MKTNEDELSEQLSVMQRAYKREKLRREYIEKMLEDQSRTFYKNRKELTNTIKALTDANSMLEDQSNVITGLSTDYDRVKQDLRYAAKLQSSVLPPPLNTHNLSVHGKLKPAQFIAGDGYDYFFLCEGILAFYMIDVVGHGAASAMISFAVQIQLNPKPDGLCQRHLYSATTLDGVVSHTLAELNQNFCHENSASQYFTMIYGLLDLGSGEVSLGQAGHPSPAFWDSSSGEIYPQGTGGTPVAILDEPNFGIHNSYMDPGDRIFIYSDGVTECRNKDDVEFGSENLDQAIRECALLSPEESTDLIADSVTSWNGSEELEDDLSILLIEYRRR